MIMYWVSLLTISILLYVLLDGFDLGIGILFGLTRDQARRHAMWGAVAPIWDGNETWLVVTAVILWGAFPAVYAMLLPAFYLPLAVMLSGLILRGVAFEFRYKASRMRWIWDLSFFGGSLVATFVQGMTVGALVEGLPITNGQYTGGAFGWFSPFAALCGAGLCFGYALLGACWLVRKCEGDVKNAAYRQIPYLSIGLLLFLAGRLLHHRLFFFFWGRVLCYRFFRLYFPGLFFIAFNDGLFSTVSGGSLYNAFTLFGFVIGGVGLPFAGHNRLFIEDLVHELLLVQLLGTGNF